MKDWLCSLHIPKLRIQFSSSTHSVWTTFDKKNNNIPLSNPRYRSLVSINSLFFYRTKLARVCILFMPTTLILAWGSVSI
jgi:hypothetical protein